MPFQVALFSSKDVNAYIPVDIGKNTGHYKER